MTTASGAAKVKPANGSGFCRNSRHVDGGQTERQHGKFESEFFRIHVSRLLSNEKFERENLNAPERRRDARRVIFPFLKSRNGKQSLRLGEELLALPRHGEELAKSVRVSKDAYWKLRSELWFFALA
jgi:hypothetical protein